MTGFESKRQAAQDKMELADAYALAVAATPNMPTPLERKLAVERIERARNALEAALEQQAEPVAREGFEKWAKFAAPYMDISRFEAGYSDCNTDYAWVGWQAALAQPQQQAEPTCPDCKAAVLYECVACSSNNYPPQRQWVGLTDEEILSTDPWEILRADPWMGTSDSNINPYQILLKVRTLEAKLKERNT